MIDWKSEYEAEHVKRLVDKARIAELEAALDSISEIGVSNRLDICQAMLRGVMTTAKSVLKDSASSAPTAANREGDPK